MMGDVQAVPVVLLGPGAVGRALLRQIVAGRRVLAERRSLRLAVTAVCDSRVFIHSKQELHGELDDGVLLAVAGAKGAGQGLDSFAGSSDALEAVQRDASGVASGRNWYGPPDWLERCGSARGVVVDCTASDGLAGALVASMDRGWDVALANKLPLVADWPTFARIAGRDAGRGDRSGDGRGDGQASARGRAMWEATVGSALPVVAALERLLDADDRPRLIEGTFSGTMNFLTNGLREGKPFGALVREARERSYTEPDPRTDLGGVDLARKALILARMCGLRLEMADVDIEALHPPEFDELGLLEFLQRVDEADDELLAKVEQARAMGGVLRYIARIDLTAGTCVVGPRTVPASSPLGMLRGTDNLVTIHSRWYDPEPLVLQGRGAGVDATAAGVLADVVALAVCVDQR